MRASIDIGSNSIILLIAEVKDNHLTEVINVARVTALGKGIDKTGELDKTSIEDSLQALREYVEIIKECNVDNITVTATEALRSVKNKSLFLDEASKLGLHINLITAEAEAHFTAKGVSLSPNLKDTLSFTIMDIGGASTELIQVQNDSNFKIKQTVSLKCGSVRGYDWLTEGTFEENMKNVLSSHDVSKYEAKHLICVAGSMTSLGGMALGLKTFEDKKINGEVIKFDHFLKFIDTISNKTPDTLLNDYPFLGKRAKTIVAGAKVAIEIAKKIQVETFEISTYGLRHGVCLEGKIDEQFIFRS